MTLPRSIERTALALFVAIFAASAYFVQGAGVNQNSRFDLVRAVVEEGTLSIDAYAGNTFDRAFKDGHYYTDKAPGLSLASVPVYAAIRATGGADPEPDAITLHAVTVLVIGTTSALAAAALFLTLLGMGIRRLLAALATFGWALGTNAFGYATLYYAHQFVAALLVGAFCLLRACRDPSRARHVRWLAPLAGALASWATISEYPAGAALGLLFAYGAATLGLKKTAPFALGAAAPAILLMAYNAACFGSPFALSYAYFDRAGHLRQLVDQGLFGVSVPGLRPIGDALFGEMRGLVPLSPFLLLAVPGAVSMARDPEQRAEAWLAIAIAIFFVLLAAGHNGGEAGAAMGLRYAVPMIPFAVLLAARGFERARRLPAPYGVLAAAGCAALVAASIAICTMTVAVMPELADQRHVLSPSAAIADPDMLHPLRTFVLPLFFHGYLSVKGVMPNGTFGLGYTAPGHAWDAFNLGEGVGLHGLWSLLPLMLIWAAAVAVILTTRNEAPLTKPEEDPKLAEHG